MQSCQVMPKTGVLSLHPRHVGFAHNLVTLLDKHWINLPTVRDIEETVSAFDNLLQRFESRRAPISNHPCQNSSALVIDCCPNPQLVALVAHKRLQFI